MSDVKTVSFREAKVGDFVMRVLIGSLPSPLRVSKIEGHLIKCGDWEFDQSTGAEINKELGWGAPPKMTGSFLKSGTFRTVSKTQD